MMKEFDCVAAVGSYRSTPQILPYREALWTAAFGVESLDGLFDMTPAEQAIPLFDAAIAAFNDRPDELRELLADEDRVGLRGNRRALLGIRAFLAQHGGTISGADDVELPDSP